ncbi:hypothetical protein WM40_17170 [Robbsia andropogonis]|uniref:Short-chain dehydrogenase n=1 Tax=Robbsia andropogonis TaxID=28092 RepID=A0A0F5JXF0_9BURK|nr:SDR family oxidoreductase [Robbsia andropogonis]KKB62521.1 hypothetical protein WM40_17170 [Robbsia andropogonis]MCP1116965.1 SDR family oxidoreductase [Robbsia andropogonis]MCP1126356.1 SDR family oxidoreductase [Robbsia andropogonis]
MRNVLVVAGGTSGIGEATALYFAKREWDVAIIGRNAVAGERIEGQLNSCGGFHSFYEADLTDPEQVTQVFGDITSRYSRLDAAFNCAGILGTPANIPDQSLAELRRVLDVNLSATFLCLQHQMRIMSAQGHGSIVNCSSIGGVVGMPGIAPYVASKHALIGLTKSAALEVAPAGVRVNCVSPGATYTPMQEKMIANDPNLEASLAQSHPLGRIARPDEIASAVFWLSASDATFVTGTNVMVDGGFSAR